MMDDRAQEMVKSGCMETDNDVFVSRREMGDPLGGLLNL